MPTHIIIILIGLGVIVALGISLCVYLLYLRHLAAKSIFWPSTEATINYCKVSVSLTGRRSTSNNWSMRWGYTFQVGSKEFRGRRYFFGSSVSGIPVKQMIEMEDRFERKEKITVYYDPRNPKISTVIIGIHKHLQISLAISFFVLCFFAMGFINILNRYS